jgi:hypothetical protein
MSGHMTRKQIQHYALPAKGSSSASRLLRKWLATRHLQYDQQQRMIRMYGSGFQDTSVPDP